MLASVLNSSRAIQINIQVVRVFIKVREILAENKSIQNQLDIIQEKLTDQDEKIIQLFRYYKQLVHENQRNSEQQNRRRIGFKRSDD